jgi:NADH-quinone oxidoreductase subunit J
MVELVVFILAGAACLAGALGVVLNRNPVHAALSLVATLFGIAVLFVAQQANFLAAVQVIVYAGAIVVLFLFVLMLLGVDQAEDLSIEPLRGQRLAAAVVGLGVLALPLLALLSTSGEATGARPAEGAANHLTDGVADIDQLGRSLFTDYLFAFEATSALLVIAIVGAVVMSRKVRRADFVDDPLETVADAEAQGRADADPSSTDEVSR